MTTEDRPVVVVGLPRSGTTWTQHVLSKTPGARRIIEPDNEDIWPAAIHAKRRLGRYPTLAPGDSAPAYRRLWEWALAGGYETSRSRLARWILGPGRQERIFDGRRNAVTLAAATLAMDPSPAFRPVAVPAPSRVIAKSIHAQLALEWISSQFDVQVVVLHRHPASVLASWLEVNLKDSRNATLELRPEIRARYVDRWGVRLPGDDPVEQMSWRIGLLLAALEEAAARNPAWHVCTHEALCSDPAAQFQGLFDDLGLEWGPRAITYLHQQDRPGSGFALRRVASGLSDSWQRRLDDDQLATLRRVLSWFPVSTWSPDDFERAVPGDS